MASGVKGLELLRQVAPPPPRAAQGEGSGSGDFKAELQRHQPPAQPSKRSDPDEGPKPAPKAGDTAGAPSKGAVSGQEAQETDPDRAAEAVHPGKEPQPVETSETTAVAEGEDAEGAAPAHPEKKPDSAEAPAGPEVLAAIAQPSAPPVQKADPQTPEQPKESPAPQVQGVRLQPVAPPSNSAHAKVPAAEQPADATQTPAPSSQEPTAAAAAVAAAAPVPTKPAPQSPKAAPSAEKVANSPSPAPDLALPQEAGVKVNPTAGGKPKGQPMTEGQQASVQAGEDASALAAQPVDGPEPALKLKVDDTAGTQVVHLLEAAGPKPSTSAATAGGAPSLPAPRPEAQFAETNHPSIVSAIRHQLLPGGGSMQLRLDPPELGAMQVTVRMRDGIMTASFETSNDEATRVLSHSLNQLKTALESQGVQVDKLQVRQQTAPSSHNQGDGAQQQQQQAQDNPARQQQQRRELMRRMWAKLALGDEPLDITG